MTEFEKGYYKAILDLSGIIAEMMMEDTKRYQDMIKSEAEKDDPDYEAVISTKRINQIAGTTYKQISEKLVDLLVR